MYLYCVVFHVLMYIMFQFFQIDVRTVAEIDVRTVAEIDVRTVAEKCVTKKQL